MLVINFPHVMRTLLSARQLVLPATLLIIGNAQAAPVNFEDHVKPLFKKHCLSCHNPDKKKADLDLTTVQSVQIGSSGGEVVKAGVPDTSVLFMVMDHHEDFDPMPPKKPKLSESDLTIVSDWIAGGLLETANGKSQLREMSFDVSTGSSMRPETPAIPVSVPRQKLLPTHAPPPVVALTASPWANVVAASGHRQVLLYTPSSEASSSRQITAAEDLIVHRKFDDGEREGKVGSAASFSGTSLSLEEIPPRLTNLHDGFTVSLWVNPDPDTQTATVFGNPSFYLFLERRKEGWTTRVASRSTSNAVRYFGRVGEIESGVWSHIAVTTDGEEWIFYHNGKEVARQSTNAEQPGFLDSGDKSPKFYAGGDGFHAERNYQGGMDELAVHQRVLTLREIQSLAKSSSIKLTHKATLPFPVGTIHDLRFSRNGELLLAAGGVGSQSGSALLFDVNTGEQQASIGDEQDVILSADISPDHKTIAIGTPAKRLKLFSTKAGELLHNIDKHTDWVTKVRFSPDGKLVASGDRNGGIHVWEVDTGGIVYTLDEHKVRITDLSWRSDSKLLASSAEDGKFVLWDMNDGWPSRTATTHSSDISDRYSRRTGILGLQFLENGEFVTVGRDRFLRITKPDGSRGRDSAALSVLPTSLATLPDGNFAVTGNLQGEILLHDLETMTTVQSFRQPTAD